MSDKTWLNLWYLSSEAKDIIDIFHEFEKNEGHQATMYGHQHEVEGGGEDYIQKAVKECLTFWGSHGTGINYGPVRFASCRGIYADASVNISGSLVIIINDDGIINLEDLKTTNEYMEVQEMVDIEIKKERIRIKVINLGDEISAMAAIQLELKRKIKVIGEAEKLSDLERFVNNNELSEDIPSGTTGPTSSLLTATPEERARAAERAASRLENMK